MDPRTLRADIPALDETIYLNTGASGPVPTQVRNAAVDRLTYQSTTALHEEGIYPAAYDVYDTARAKFADHLQTDTAAIALTESTADGIARLAAAMDWSSDDIIVRTDTEHPAGRLPWQRLERRYDVTVRTVETDNGHIDPEQFQAAVDGATLACVSSICWRTGHRRPIEQLTELAHEAGARMLVDAVQSFGQHPIDVGSWDVDVLAASTHKWPMGLWGGGLLYVAPSFADTLVPAQIGYRGVEDAMADHYELQEGAMRFELGTSSPLPYAAAVEALELVAAIGYETITDRIERLTRRLIDGLPADRVRSPIPPQSGLVVLETTTPQATVDRLDAAGIKIRTIPNADAVRVSVHVFNTPGDIDTLLETIEL